jgi:hypothetical protein
VAREWALLAESFNRDRKLLTRIDGVDSLGAVRSFAAVRRSDRRQFCARADRPDLARGRTCPLRPALGAWLARALAALTVFAGTLEHAHGQAQERTQGKAAIVLEGEGCPGAELVRQMLAPLVSEPVVLAGEPNRAAAERAVYVRDLGAEYAIEMQDAQRIHSDPARNCAERARVAAVFIALNLQESANGEGKAGDAKALRAAAASDLPASTSASAASGGTSSRTVSWPLHGGIGAWASVHGAPGRAAVAPGGAAAVWLELAALRLQLSAELLGKVALPLTPREPGGSAELWRVPLGVSAGYVWRASRFALEPRLGVAVDVLRIRARGVSKSERELRANTGAQLGLSGRIFLAARLALCAGLAGSWFPRSYALRVEPAPRSAHTPKLWLAGQLGLEFMLR